MESMRRSYVLLFVITLSVTIVIPGFASSGTALQPVTQPPTTDDTVITHSLATGDTTGSTIETANESSIQIRVNDSSNGRDIANTTVTVDTTDTPNNETNDTANKLPTELEDSLTIEQYNAVLNGGSELTAPKLSNAINGWASRGSVNEVSISAPVLSELINYWANS